MWCYSQVLSGSWFRIELKTEFVEVWVGRLALYLIRAHFLQSLLLATKYVVALNTPKKNSKFENHSLFDHQDILRQSFQIPVHFQWRGRLGVKKAPLIKNIRF